MACTMSPFSGPHDHHERVDERASRVVGLPDPDGLEHHIVEVERVEDIKKLGSARAEAIVHATAGHRAHVEGRMRGDMLHANAISEQRTAGDGARRIDRENANASAVLQQLTGPGVDQTAFARAGSAGNPSRRARFMPALRRFESPVTPAELLSTDVSRFASVRRTSDGSSE